MPTNIPVASPGANAASIKDLTKGFDGDLFAVALFSSIGLLLALIAITCGEQGIWF